MNKKILNSKKQKTKRLEIENWKLVIPDAVSVTVGPGLATSLQVGIDAAKTLSYIWHRPIIPVNHLEGHLLSPLLPEEKGITNYKLQITNKSQNINYQLPKITFPAIALIDRK